MAVYAITVREIMEKTVCVEAEDMTDAIDKVERAYHNVEIIIEPEDLSEKEFVPSCYAGKNGLVDVSELESYRKDYQWIGDE